MNNESLVSVIIPMYNAEKYILETIQSVILQTYKNWEMIIVDNKSTDNSILVVKSVKDERIKLVKLEYNSGGPARPRNIGINNAKGEYIAFLDADDLWLPLKLEKQISIMLENNLDFTSTYCSLIDAKGIEVSLSKLSRYYNKKISKKNMCDLIKNNFILTSSVVVIKDILESFSEDKRLIAVEDYDLWLRVLDGKIDKYKYIDESLIEYRVVDGSASERGNKYKQEIKAYLAICGFMIEKNNFNLIKCFILRIMFVYIRTLLK